MSKMTQKETWLKCELYYTGGCAVQTKSACDACKEKVWMNHPDYQKKNRIIPEVVFVASI